MTFVNEIIPDQEKLKIDFPVQTLSDGTMPTLWKWSIDRDKGAVLIHTGSSGGGYEGTQETQHYVLKWEESLIRFSGDASLDSESKTVTWKIHRLVIPLHLISRQAEILTLIKEGLDAIGWLYRRSRVNSVVVNFEDAIANGVA